VSDWSQDCVDVLNAVRPEQEGQASGANNAIRELGGVFGVAALVGAAAVAVGALAAFAIPGAARGGTAPEARVAFAEAPV
jgi:hypothetical protein